jgi:TIR domain
VTDLFLSHSTVDDVLATAIAECLKEVGVNPLQASRGISSAQDWSDRIREDLTSADQALFLVTPHYMSKPVWLYMEWAASWVREARPHLLLIDVDSTELPDVMRETQVTVFDGNTERLGRSLLSVITGLEVTDPKCTTLAARIARMIETESATWEEAKWSRVTAEIARGSAALPDADLDWIVAKGRVPELVTRLRDDFAHPALVHKVARHLVAGGYPREAALLAALLPGHIQASLFHDILPADTDAARTIADVATDRATRRECATTAAATGFPDVAEAIADMTEYAHDKRVIAERLL